MKRIRVKAAGFLVLFFCTQSNAGVRNGLCQIWEGTKEVATGIVEAVAQPFKGCCAEKCESRENLRDQNPTK